MDETSEQNVMANRAELMPALCDAELLTLMHLCGLKPDDTQMNLAALRKGVNTGKLNEEELALLKSDLAAGKFSREGISLYGKAFLKPEAIAAIQAQSSPSSEAAPQVPPQLSEAEIEALKQRIAPALMEYGQLENRMQQLQNQGNILGQKAASIPKKSVGTGIIGAIGGALVGYFLPNKSSKGVRAAIAAAAGLLVGAIVGFFTGKKLSSPLLKEGRALEANATQTMLRMKTIENVLNQEAAQVNQAMGQDSQTVLAGNDTPEALTHQEQMIRDMVARGPQSAEERLALSSHAGLQR